VAFGLLPHFFSQLESIHDRHLTVDQNYSEGISFLPRGFECSQRDGTALCGGRLHSPSARHIAEDPPIGFVVVDNQH
jgi:hypothetical protein